MVHGVPLDDSNTSKVIIHRNKSWFDAHVYDDVLHRVSDMNVCLVCLLDAYQSGVFPGPLPTKDGPGIRVLDGTASRISDKELLNQFKVMTLTREVFLVRAFV